MFIFLLYRLLCSPKFNQIIKFYRIQFYIAYSMLSSLSTLFTNLIALFLYQNHLNVCYVVL